MRHLFDLRPQPLPFTRSRMFLRLLSLLVVLSTIALSPSMSGQQARIFLTAPASGANLIVDSTYRIRWFMQNVTGLLRIEYSVDSGSTWKFIDTMSAHAGSDSLDWRVPNDTTRLGFVRVRTVDSVTRGSNRTPIIISAVALPILRLIYPNGGELLRTDSTYFVRWTSSFTNGAIDIDYSIDSGATWRTIASKTPAGGTDSVLWTTPSDTTSRALVRVRSTADNIADVSSRTFSIRSTIAPRITLTYPNGGQVFAADSTIRIRWTGVDLSGQIIAQYSADNGATWNAIGNPRTARIGNDSLTWRIPNDTTNTALVRLQHVGGTASDTSDATFTIIPNPNPPIPPTPTITLISPMGGGVYRADSIVTVRWRASNISGLITLEYSPDSGASWMPFHQAQQRGGVDTVNWTVPNDSTHTAILRVRNSDATADARTTAPFTVLPRRLVLGIAKEHDAYVSLVVAPDPSRDVVLVHWMQREVGTVRLRVVNARGEIAMTQTFEATRSGEQATTVNVDDLAPGSYWLNVESGRVAASAPFVVVR